MGLVKAITWTVIWIVAAMLFNVGIYHIYGIEKASEFANVYIIEKLLSFDNLFVFLLVFNHFAVPQKDRRKVLNWGFGGAVALRALFIGLGVTFVSQFHWLLYVMGGVLIYSAYGVVFGGDDETNISESRVIKFAKSLSIRPIFVWIAAIELSDIVFAIDSIPAALAISQDAFIIYTANIFAILGLRSLFFVMQYLYDYIPQLKYGIAVILAFIGVKMLLPLVGTSIDSSLSLVVVMGILIANILLILTRKILEDK